MQFYSSFELRLESTIFRLFFRERAELSVLKLRNKQNPVTLFEANFPTADVTAMGSV